MKCQIKKSWLKMESEHTKTKAGQMKIVREHINTYGCSYYPALKKLETKLKGGKINGK